MPRRRRAEKSAVELRGRCILLYGPGTKLRTCDPSTPDAGNPLSPEEQRQRFPPDPRYGMSHAVLHYRSAKKARAAFERHLNSGSNTEPWMQFEEDDAEWIDPVGMETIAEAIAGS